MQELKSVYSKEELLNNAVELLKKLIEIPSFSKDELCKGEVMRGIDSMEGILLSASMVGVRGSGVPSEEVEEESQIIG